MEELADQTKEMTKERVDAIREDLRPYMLRRTKDQVLNLPPLVRPAHLPIFDLAELTMLSVVYSAPRASSSCQSV